FTAAGLRAFGPTAAAAQLEGSKAFTKELLRHERVPTAFFGAFTDPDDAVRYVREVGAPIVVKADGLASGKGVFICATVDDVVERTCTGRLAGTQIAWDPRAAACVVLAAEGYPGGVERGRPISGVEALRGWRDGVVFHAGTRRVDGRFVTDGGRVLGVTAL